jgi:hypothetical protein
MHREHYIFDIATLLRLIQPHCQLNIRRWILCLFSRLFIFARFLFAIEDHGIFDQWVSSLRFQHVVLIVFFIICCRNLIDFHGQYFIIHSSQFHDDITAD